LTGVQLADPIRICFVCFANIVRSPLAEHVFLHQAQQAGVAERYHVRSAGTGNLYAGEPPDLRMRRVAARHGLNYDGRSRQFTAADFGKFDLILAMDQENFQVLVSLAPDSVRAGMIHMLREFDPQGGISASVPDPYYGAAADFEEVYQIIERSSQGLLRFLEQAENGGEAESLA
jgi:low molecular weight protein-tyrosine phosphatase